MAWRAERCLLRPAPTRFRSCERHGVASHAHDDSENGAHPHLPVLHHAKVDDRMLGGQLTSPASSSHVEVRQPEAPTSW